MKVSHTNDPGSRAAMTGGTPGKGDNCSLDIVWCRELHRNQFRGLCVCEFVSGPSLGEGQHVSARVVSSDVRDCS